ncbi:MAG TPA: TIGR04282 family arsenosugar biosynthesis glycosyltransferase [Candidatus Udaeobacter sp.]|nr:TIGR04282 family arsenosugar biosynthesis glycosyltransferase [Candidatus Udaeobacter sp.]
MRANALAIMAKAPKAGQVKTRLLPALSAKQAAELCRALIKDQLEHLQTLTVADLYLAFTPAKAAPLVKQLAPPPFRLICQEGDDLGERMKRLFEHLRALGHKNIVLIGSDLPALPSLFFDEAYAYLQSPTARAVLGPSRDGGYYLIGLNQSLPQIFEAMAWSHDQVLEQTRVKLASLRIDTLLLPLWFDIDTPDDLRRLKSQFDLDASLAKRMKHTAALLSGWELSGRQDRAG